MKKSIPILLLALLLAKPDWAFTGAKNGLVLWGMVVLPTLMPFMLCSQAIVGLGAVPILMKPFGPFLSHILHVSYQGGYVFLTGLLCGYPMGAKTCGEFLQRGLITPAEARYLLAVSNHPSPMFLLGYVMSQISAVFGLSAEAASWKLLAALYLPILPIGFLARHQYRPESSDSAFPSPSAHPASSFSLDAAFLSCAETMVKIGGYIMLFSIAALYTSKLPFSSPYLRCALLGALEITTGISVIASSMTGNAAVLLITASAAFGGISGIFQTKSVLDEKNAGLSIRHYVLWKLLHGILSCMVMALLCKIPISF